MNIIKSNPQISQKEMVTKSGFSRSKIQRILKVLQGKKVIREASSFIEALGR